MSSKENKTRVAIVVSHPIQHFIHLYRALAKEPSMELLVIFCTDIGHRQYFDENMGVEISWEMDLLSGYRSIFLPEAKQIEKTGFLSVNNPSIKKTFGEFRPDVVQLHGYGQLTLLRALLWCRLRRIPALLWSDSSLLFKRGKVKEAVKTMLLNLLLKQFKAVLTTGDNNEQYYRRYGMPEKKLFRCPFTVDEAAFARVWQLRETLRGDSRDRYNIDEDALVMLFVGKLVSWKRPKDILDALRELRSRGRLTKKMVVFFAGDGVLRKELEQQAEDERLPVVFGGFINVDQLPSIYVMADMLIFPSDREPYGLSAREAICFGLPVIASDQIGCVGESDAARPDQNAIVYPAGNVQALADAMSLLNTEASLRKRMGQESLRVAEQIALEASVGGFLGAVASCVRQ